MMRLGIPDVVVIHPEMSMRRLLHTALAESGYAVTEAASYAAILCRLRTASRPIVVVVGNATLDFQPETAFFGQVAAEAALAGRHRRFVLLSPNADRLPDELGATLHRLGVAVLPLPIRLDALLAALAQTARPASRARRTPAKDSPAG